MDKLESYIHELNVINNNLLYALSTKMTDDDRNICVDKIDKQCKLIKPLNDEEKKQFIDLIKNYIVIQEEYKQNKIRLITIQLQLRNPNLTEQECNKIIMTGQYKNALCVYDVHSVHDYVTLRHKEILKLEASIDELKELFIATYALVYMQGEQVDRIALSVENAKENVAEAKVDLVETYKHKKHWKKCF